MLSILCDKRIIFLSRIWHSSFELRLICKMLEFQSVSKSFSGLEGDILVVVDVSFHIRSGEFIAIIGPSGSGKSTLLGLAAGLDQPNQGKILLDGEEISGMSEDALARIRSTKVGFVFQNFQLLPNLTALENVAIPLMVSSQLPEKEILDRGRMFLDSVGMGHRAQHFPQQLSGGEEQRVAIARSFINHPRILFADEPTANLDSKNGVRVMELLIEMNRSQGSTLVVVTHDPNVAMLADRVFTMADGRLSEDRATRQEPKSRSRAVSKSKSRAVSKSKSSAESRSKSSAESRSSTESNFESISVPTAKTQPKPKSSRGKKSGSRSRS